MYHDQGRIARKLTGFDGGVTIAGGLPVPICTPAHGTAFDVVGKGVAATGSIQNAFDLAVRIGGRGAARG
ncbi:4-hydroxythreonine-4-phosphate dehydrogenase PdxA [Streptomyces sp. NPDC049597]|uniref:4-hydroxythreonine-4-phosphate dehydrogenase PdxA n=1 Tax=Streptomyces sp. NPDC049597 TaxID=3155276 RepID=UPI003426497D